jgi:4-amino-4-deoxy-L-arabinose transferase-like glycosyltransferase
MEILKSVDAQSAAVHSVEDVNADGSQPAKEGAAAQSRAIGWTEGLILLAILALAFWLRWTHVREVSLHVDEYITLRAAQQILERGIPLLPTGNFYSHGLLLSYAEAGILGLIGFDPVAARFPVLVVGLFAVALTWWVGRRWFSPSVGLLAAALLALTPDAVIWGGRARMYAPLQFFVLLAIFFYWRGLAQGGNWRHSVLFSLSFLGAMFLHAETMILLPAFVLIAVAMSWPELRSDGVATALRRWWRTGLIVAWLIAALGVLAELWFRRLGPPMVSRLAKGVYGPSTRTYVRIALDWSGIVKTLEPVLTSAVVLAIMSCLLAGFVYWLLRQRGNGTPLWPEGWGPPLAYLVALLGLTLPVLLFAADPSWKSPRYLFMLLPLFYLALSACLFALTRQFKIGRRREWLALGVALVGVAVGFWPSAWASAREEVAGYDYAFEYLASHWQPGDAIMTFVPQAGFLHLNAADYLSVPIDYRGFAYEEGGHWLEGWDAIPLVDSGQGVADALAAHARLWFVVDEHRFHTRFSPDLTQAVWDGMDLVWHDEQVMVFRTADPPPPVEHHERKEELGGQLILEGYALEATPEPGSDLPMTLYWSATGFPAGLYSTFVHLVDVDNTGWAQDDGPPLGAVYPTNQWWPGEILRDRKILSLPEDLPSALYRLESGVYDPVTMSHLTTKDGRDRVILGFVRVGEPQDLPSDLNPVDVVFDDQIRLIGYALAPVGDRTWTLALAWAAERPLEQNYTAFVHLVDKAGEIRGQHDAPPGGGFYPTSFWEPGEIVLDTHDLALPADAPAGVYRLWVGLYEPESSERLPTKTGDFFELQEWTIP